MGGFTHLWNLSKYVSGFIASDVLFLDILMFVVIESIIIGNLVSIPFEYYKTFVVEEKHGFNKTTMDTFVKDQFKSAGLSLAFAPVIYWGACKIINWGGQNFFYILWIFGMVLMVVFMLIWPTYIAPLFNKFIVLGKDEEATEKEIELRERIETISKKLNFPCNEIYKIDGSKRSDHSQAYFFGIFKKKRIVIYDTLIKQCENEEIEAILFHELGHWFFSHNVQLIGINFMMFFLISYWINIFIFDQDIYRSFKLPNETFVGLNLTMFTIGPVYIPYFKILVDEHFHEVCGLYH